MRKRESPSNTKLRDYTTDDEDLITYDVQEEELEPDKFVIKECPQNFPEGYLHALTPFRYRKTNSHEIAETEAWISVQGTRKPVETSCVCKYQERNVRGDVSVRKTRDVGARCSTVKQNEGRRRNSTYSLQVPVSQFVKYGLKKSPGRLHTWKNNRKAGGGAYCHQTSSE
ncbi:hypothetical protein TNCV_3227531 [Trichonephila clavipes]|nr:hypothetical protein TNCV_3227531 [Trichonephila clavipes]